ncbi:hypothetical protein ACFP81_15000 [Deinococcus lacus]|uniref:Uncharacterized protein n=2 Tax=Deinococcus lacus TaxID=392561 RepID=A0ABW1YJ23_9DEIO
MSNPRLQAIKKKAKLELLSKDERLRRIRELKYKEDEILEMESDVRNSMVENRKKVLDLKRERDSGVKPLEYFDIVEDLGYTGIFLFEKEGALNGEMARNFAALQGHIEALEELDGVCGDALED